MLDAPEAYGKTWKKAPLEMPVMIKTSGIRPTRNNYFTENEWAKPHSNKVFFPKRVDILPSQNYI